MPSIKSVSSDELFEAWLKDADLKTLEKRFKKKKVDFKRANVSAVETVKGVKKFIVIYFEKDVKKAIAAGKEEVVTILANKIGNQTYYDFKGKSINFDSWNQKEQEVPMYPTLTKVSCKTCGGSGTQKCKKCGGTFTLNCPKCDGKGKIECKKCKGEKNIDEKVEVIEYNDKKRKAIIPVPCPECHGKGAYTCPNCAGMAKIPCKNCSGSNVDCKECKGYGVVYQYKIQPVPFISKKKQAMVFYEKGIQKFITTKDVEALLNAREIQGISVTNPDDLNQKFLKPQLNYWEEAQDADKICKEAKKEYKDLVKKNVVRKGQKILVFPAIQLSCSDEKGKSFYVFGIGTSGSFVIIDSGFNK